MGLPAPRRRVGGFPAGHGDSPRGELRGTPFRGDRISGRAVAVARRGERGDAALTRSPSWAGSGVATYKVHPRLRLLIGPWAGDAVGANQRGQVHGRDAFGCEQARRVPAYAS